MKVGFVGLGAMGRGMAARLLDAGHEVDVWNRSPQVVRELVQSGASAVDDVRDIVRADAVVTMLSDDDAVRSIILDNGLLQAAATGIVHIVMSTLSVSFALELEQLHADARIGYVAAPVMGRPDAAASGKLHVLAAGDSRSLERVRPILDAMGQRIWLLGAAPHQANVVKLAMNFLLGSAIEALSEATAMAEGYNIDSATLIEVATGTAFAAPVYVTYGKLIVDREFKPGFRLRLGLKDLRLALTAGEARGVPLPFASVVRDNLVDAIGHGDAESDWSALASVSRRRAGLA
jgi:3-hydroxyisobutyrate dehydrogenase-like beta-hydroxyacid dehydrogenase